ncbi:MAG TPA: exo-beta-N-acetylmuramidase NamZ domain-containing protein [Longimicrobium sp.]|nr:exo-beta-N-acetylmuramidase NamZ domain-containing protein [Longimicrobium sp.]
MTKLLPTAILLAACAQAPAPASDVAAGADSTGLVRPGIETFLADLPPALRGKRVGLITNHTGIDRARTPDIDLIARHPDLRLVALLAPEHGIRGTVEAGERIDDERDAATGVPIYSLYQSEDRGPTPEMLREVDVLVYDLQEVGGRTWTYVSTMALSMQARRGRGFRSWCWTGRTRSGARSWKAPCSIRASSPSWGCTPSRRGTG